MSAYVESVLAAGENVVYRASISRWKYFISYFGGTLLIALGLGVLYYLYPWADPLMAGLAAIPILAGLAMLLFAVVHRSTTELVVTDRRIIAKRGILSRETVEMNLAKVESLQVSQGVWGRMLNYGDVSVVGTGSSLEPMRGVSRPLELRRKLGELADSPALGRRSDTTSAETRV
jgi:uncharacterized membrane protein YdbT with pleckstrin-like domain